MLNRTEVSGFILSGLTDLQGCGGLQHFFFITFLLFYLTSLLGNSAIVTMVIFEPRLQTPTYFFLGNLSCLDIFYSTDTVSKMLIGFLFGHQPISFGGCLAQLHFFHFLDSTEAVLLAVMAYDHYVAICNPLRYTLIMSSRTCLFFCGHSHIHHFFCDIKPLLNLACSSTSLNLTLLSVVTTSIALAPFAVILLSYLYIIFFLFLKFKSKGGRQKVFSTCASHLIVVALLYVPVFFNYALPSSGSSSKREMQVFLTYIVVTPALNPLIYTLIYTWENRGIRGLKRAGGM
uniref:G-protein coupled receptors family 1 profile domain-containing protein n=1 Tax=Apteryx owenii TaxID=8824 RepID=A0A8B9P357_APTOW